MGFKSSVLIFLISLSLSCTSIAPTPVLMGRMVKLNNIVTGLYVDCSEGANYVPTKEECDVLLLSAKTGELLYLSEEFISADIKQPQGYDIHLVTTMIYFRMGQRNMNEYTRAEQIARQFFETQKAHMGHSIDVARFYWAWFAASTASKQYYEEPYTLTRERKAELLLALGEGTALLGRLEGVRLIRLQQALRILKAVVDAIP